jgi:hypothetical protein
MAKRTKIKKVANAEIRAAKKFLESKGLESDEVSPRKFATAAKKLETLEILARTLSAGQV